MDGILGWHFLSDDRRLGYSDCRDVVDGKTLVTDGPVRLCSNGMHASQNIRDALEYAPGLVICRVRISGSVMHGDDKMAGLSRKCIWSVDGEKLLRRFARWCALQQVHLWDPPKIVMTYLKYGRETDHNATYGTAYSAAYSAADSAACGAACGATYGAAYSTARSAQEKELLRLVWAAHRGERIPKTIARKEW